jgi:hypothetical protein
VCVRVCVLYVWCVCENLTCVCKCNYRYLYSVQILLDIIAVILVLLILPYFSAVYNFDRSVMSAFALLVESEFAVNTVLF